jgi:integrase
MTKTSARSAERAGLVDFTYHDLRPTLASRLVMAGVDLATLRELMGHKHSTMTLRYIHLAPGHMRPAIAVWDRFGKRVPANFSTTAEVPSDHMSQVIDK